MNESLLDIFEPPRARHTDPSTSKISASRVKFGKRRKQILKSLLLRQRGGGTAAEIARDLNVGRDIVSPQLKPLEQLGFVTRSPMTRLDKATGHAQQVWVLSDKGFLARQEFEQVSGVLERSVRSCCPHCGGIL